MLRLKRRHRRSLIMGLIVLLTLSWVSLGCYGCELGQLAAPEAGQHEHHAGSDNKACHDEAPNAPCPHCAAMAGEHNADGGCDSALCVLYQVTADEQVGWSPASADQNLDFHPLLLGPTPALLARQTGDVHPTRLIASTHIDTHPTAAFCVLLI